MKLKGLVIYGKWFALVIMTMILAGVAMAQSIVESQQQSIAPPKSQLMKFHLNQLHLEKYEAAVGDLSLCSNNLECLDYVKRIKSWCCAAEACEGKGKVQKPLECFEGVSSKYTKKIIGQVGPLICPLIKHPTPRARRAILVRIPSPEDEQVEHLAGFMAVKESAASCEEYIKTYVGAYGPQWKSTWYKAMSGCRILSGERTRVQEERDFDTWFGVTRGVGACSDISNKEMRNACSAPGATPPVS